MSGLRQTALTCSGHTRPVVDLAFSSITPSGFFLISACKDGKPMLRQGDTGDWIGTFVGHKGAVWGVALNKDASKAASGSADFEAKLWDAINGGELHSFSHPHIVKSVHFNSDDSKLLTGSNDKKVRIFDLHRPEENGEVLAGHTGAVKKALFLHNDKKIVSAADDKSVRFWDLASLQEFKKIEFETQPNSLEISHNGNILVITHGHSVSFWDIENFEKLKEYSVPSQVNSACLHPDQSVFVCGGDDFKMYKFDYENGNEIESFKGHFGPVHCVHFSPDGEVYASGSEDGTLRLWQTIVGKTYGLWKCEMPGEIGNDIDIAAGDAPVIKADS